MITTLRTKPSYDHVWECKIAKSKLDAMSAEPVFQKLKNHLAISKKYSCPAMGWRGEIKHRSLFQPNGFHYPVRWMPDLTNNFRRLSYSEFCAFYELAPFDNRLKQ